MPWTRADYESDLRQAEALLACLREIYPEDHPPIVRQRRRIDVLTRILTDPRLAELMTGEGT